MEIINSQWDLGELEAPFAKFVEGMRYKLFINMHKQTPSHEDMNAMMGLLMIEMGEFLTQYRENKHDPNAEKETFDIGNFAFMLYIVLKQEQENAKVSGTTE